MVAHVFANPGGVVCRDELAVLLEAALYERNPVLGAYCRQFIGLTKLVEGHALVLEQVGHQMFLAPIEAV